MINCQRTRKLQKMIKLLPNNKKTTAKEQKNYYQKIRKPLPNKNKANVKK